MSQASGAKKHKSLFRRALQRTLKKSRKRVIRYGLLGANLAILVAVVGFVMKTPDSQAVRQSALSVDNNNVSNPLDQPSSSDIAVHLARMASLPESTAVVNQADTINGQMALNSADSKVVDKPQIISTATKSRFDIQRYVSVAGDTLTGLSAKFSVTSDSIRWSNNLTNNNVAANKELFIPPVNGIVYLVKAGDTPDSLARQFNANKDAVVAFNDAEVAGLPIGQRIVIPDGSKAATGGGVGVLSYGGGMVAWGDSPLYGFNGYDRGWCTYYASGEATKRGLAIPANWGNANTWDNYAARGGWTVSTIPRAGAVAQTDAGGLGHVGIVEEVSADGSMIRYSDMNGLAGWNHVGTSSWVPTLGKFQRFIYR